MKNSFDMLCFQTYWKKFYDNSTSDVKRLDIVDAADNTFLFAFLSAQYAAINKALKTNDQLFEIFDQADLFIAAIECAILNPDIEVVDDDELDERSYLEAIKETAVLLIKKKAEKIPDGAVMASPPYAEDLAVLAQTGVFLSLGNREMIGLLTTAMNGDPLDQQNITSKFLKTKWRRYVEVNPSAMLFAGANSSTPLVSSPVKWYADTSTKRALVYEVGQRYLEIQCLPELMNVALSIPARRLNNVLEMLNKYRIEIAMGHREVGQETEDIIMSDIVEKAGLQRQLSAAEKKKLRNNGR